MIKEALAFITGLKDSRPITEKIGDHTYAVNADRTLGAVVRPVPPIETPTLRLSTLTGLVDACNAKIDDFPSHVALHVEAFDRVSLISMRADDHGRRHVWLHSQSAEVSPFRFEQFYEPEPFLIALQKSFALTDNLATLLRVCSNLAAGSSVQVADDGFSQKVVVQEGGVSRGAVELPPRVGLSPYRTFREIAPVDSDFLIRMQAKKDALPQIALFPVDGGAWKQDTVLQVKYWLQGALPGVNVIA